MRISVRFIPKKHLLNLYRSTFFVPTVAGMLLISSLGVSALVYKHSKTQPFKEPSTNQNGPTSPTPPPINSDSVTTTTPTAAPSTPVATKPIPKPPDNTAQCNSLIAQKKTDLDSLSGQAQTQLALMKSIISNHTIDGEVNGGGVNGMVSQSEITQSFNAANDKANALMAQYSTDQENYDNQLIGLSCTGWSP
jgi:hypothetical protein